MGLAVMVLNLLSLAGTAKQTEARQYLCAVQG
jgi:hypothetical protein